MLLFCLIGHWLLWCCWTSLQTLSFGEVLSFSFCKYYNYFNSANKSSEEVTNKNKKKQINCVLFLLLDPREKSCLFVIVVAPCYFWLGVALLDFFTEEETGILGWVMEWDKGYCC